MAGLAELSLIENYIIFILKIFSIISGSIGTKVKSNGFNINFVSAVVYQLSEYRILGDSGLISPPKKFR